MDTQIDLNETGVVDEITLQYHPKEGLDRVKITSPTCAVAFLRKVWNDYLEIKESFYVVLLDNSKRVTGYSMVSLGGSTATIVDPAEIIRIAVRGKCNSMVLAHNHPSGELTESRADVKITERIAEIGKILGIPLDDHIILTARGWSSFRSKGLL